MRRAWPALVAGAIAAGLALRIWVLASPLGTLESDEAIVGLMARHALDGEFSAFYWLSLYGGSQESLLTAAVFAIAGSGVLALKVVPLALYSLAALLVWRVGRWTIGEPAARVAALLFWIWPAYFVWWTTKARAFYSFGLVCALLVLLLVLRLRERDSRFDAAALGLALGLGFWATPQILALALPALAWLAVRRPAAYRLAWIAAPCFVAGAAPWLAWNALNGWKAVLPPESVAGAGSTYAGRLGDLFRFVLPTWLGLRVPYSLEWLVSPVLGIVLLALALAGFARLLVRRPRGLEPMLVVAAAFPFLYAVSKFAYFVDEPRYLVLFAPVPALLLASPLRRPAPAALALAAALALTVAGLRELRQDGGYVPIAGGARVPSALGPLLGLLEREGANRVLADYWIAYRISFESGERIVATSTGFVRYVPHDRLVRSSPAPARVFVTDSPRERAVRPVFERRGFRRLTAGGFAAYVR